jgi:hypothetical protein
MPVFLLLASSGLVMIALATLKSLAVVSQLSETIEVVDNSPWEVM